MQPFGRSWIGERPDADPLSIAVRLQIQSDTLS